MACAEISVMPVGKGEGLSEYVAVAYKIAKNSGMKIELTPMGTVRLTQTGLDWAKKAGQK